MSSDTNRRHQALFVLTSEYTPPSTKEVHIEGSAVLRIMKHSAKHAPNPASGPIMGVDGPDGVLSISHVFPFSAGDFYERFAQKGKTDQNYKQELADQLKAVGYAAQFVGWFQSSTLLKFFNKSINDALLNAQLNDNPNCILLVHDPSKVAKGVLAIRAFRLCESYIKAYLDNDSTCKLDKKTVSDYDLTLSNYLEELPVFIHNSQLVSLYLNKLDVQAAQPVDVLDVNNLISMPRKKALSTYDVLAMHDIDASNTSKFVEVLDLYNQDLNRLNSVQRLYSRDLAKIEQWKQSVKDNGGLFEGKEVDIENDWKSALKFPLASRHENFFLSTTVDGYCGDLETSGVADLIKGFTIKTALEN